MLLAAVITCFFTDAAAQPPGMAGLQIGSTLEEVLSLDMELLIHNDFAYKFNTPNGNEFSVTHDNGKVVYMENTWMYESSGESSLIPGFAFGSSLKEVQRKLGSGGFFFPSIPPTRTEEGILLFNGFDVAGHDGLVFAVITEISLEDMENDEQAMVVDKARLVGMVLADKEYLESIWGPGRNPSENDVPARIQAP